MEVSLYDKKNIRTEKHSRDRDVRNLWITLKYTFYRVPVIKYLWQVEAITELNNNVSFHI